MLQSLISVDDFWLLIVGFIFPAFFTNLLTADLLLDILPGLCGLVYQDLNLTMLVPLVLWGRLCVQELLLSLGYGLSRKQ